MSTLEQARTEKGRRVALVIGVNGSPYSEEKQLQFAESDAEAMAQVLQEHCAFELLTPPLLGKDATSSQIKTTLIEQTDILGEKDFFLFYFAGHGHAQYVEAGRLAIYLVTADFKEQHIQRDENVHISMHWLRDQLFTRPKAGAVLIILDCCHAGGIEKAASDHYLNELWQRLAYYFETPAREVDMLPGSMRWAVVATEYNQNAYERDGHGVLTGALLEALDGKVDTLLQGNEGEMKLFHLFQYLRDVMPDDQKPLIEGRDGEKKCVLAWHPERARELQQQRAERLESRAQLEKREKLGKALADPDPIRKHLKWFVGRQNELDYIEKKITDLRATGGYLVISGEAGQGKSSLIAKLVEQFAHKQGGLDKVVYHFIPPQLRSNARAYLLRELLQRLILKHPLSFAPDPSELGESILQMEELFQLVLQELVEKNHQEVIFIDGADQLASHEDDLSFLPEDPTKLPGIVFVLGRPPDTLALLKLKKPEIYSLPGLSEEDFILLLKKYQEQDRDKDPEQKWENERAFSLILSKAGLLYEKSKQYTLCLSVLARELHSQPDLVEHNEEEIFTKIDPDPEHVFDLTMSRLERLRAWETVTQPLLKLLLFAEEALTLSQLKQLLHIASSPSIGGRQVQQELGHLSGLVVQQYDTLHTDPSEQYILDHILLRKSLEKQFKYDKVDCHKYFVTWCEQEAPEHFWQFTYEKDIQERRRYARHYYITHLYHADAWDKLFEVLDKDKGEYGQQKMLEDPSGRSYRRDLTWGQDAAASCIEKMADTMRQLARLWHYAFLRCSLNSRADNYTETTFRLLLHLGPEQERKARELADMLTSRERKAHIFVLITDHLASLPERSQEAYPWALSSKQLVESLPASADTIALLLKLAATLKRIGRMRESEQIQERTRHILAHLDITDQEPPVQDFTPDWLAAAMQATSSPEAAQAGDTRVSEEESREAVNEEQMEALLAACSMLQQGYWNGDEPAWVQVEQLIYTLPDSISKANALTEFAFATQNMDRPDAAEQIRWEIIRFLHIPGDEALKDSTLRRLVETLEQRRSRPETRQIWQNIENIIEGFSDDERKEDALACVASALARVDEFEQSWKIISRLRDESRKAAALADYLLCARRAGRKEDVEACLNELSEGNIRDAARKRLAEELDRFGFWPVARRTLDAISDESVRCSARLAHAQVLIQEGFFPAAKDILCPLSEGAEQRWALAELGVAWEQSEYRAKGVHTPIGEGEQVIRTLPASTQKVWALAELAVIFAQAQNWDKATESLQEAEEMAHTLTEDELADPSFSQRWLQARTHYAIALVQERRWQQLEQISTGIVCADSFIEVLAELAQKTAAAEDLDNIARLIAQVVPDATSTVPCNWKVLRVYARLGAAWKRTGDEQKAASIWQIAEQLISNAPLPERITAVGIYACTLSETENNEEADHLWRETESVIGNLPEKQEDSLVSFATELMKAGRQEEALDVLRSLQNPWRKIRAQAKLGTTLSEQIGYRTQAKLLFEEAAVSLKEVAENKHKVVILEEMQRLLEQEGDRDQEEAIDSFLALARQLYRYGWREEAKPQLRKLEDFIQRMPDETRKREALLKLVDAHGYIKNFLDIDWIGEKFLSGRDKAHFLARYGLLLAQAGRKQEAGDKIDAIVEQSTAIPTSDDADQVLKNIRKQAQEKLLKHYWQMRDWEYAQIVIRSLDDRQTRDDVFARQGELMGYDYALHATSSQSEQEKKTVEALLLNARSVIASIADEWKQSYALITLSENMVGTEELRSEAKAICEGLEEEFSQHTGNRTGPLSGGEGDDEKKNRIEFWARLGIVYQRMGDQYKAEQLLQEAEKVILTLFWGEQEEQALEQLATAFLKTRNSQLAREVINEIIDRTRKDRLLFDLANLLMAEKQWELAEWAASSSRDDDPEDDDPGNDSPRDKYTRKEKLLFDLANLLLEEGQLEAADRIARSIVNDTLKEQVRTYRNTADARARAKHANELAGVQRWQEAQEEINSIDDQAAGSSAIRAIKYETFSNLSYSLALAQRWEDAEKVINLIDEEDTKDDARRNVVDELIKVKDWDEAEQIARSIGNQQKQERMLEVIRKEREAAQARAADREVQIDAGQPIQPEERPARPIRREQQRERERRPPAPRCEPSNRPEMRQQERARIQSLYKQWRKATTREEILEGFTPACTLISEYPELGTALWDALQHVRRFLEGVAQRAT